MQKVLGELRGQGLKRKCYLFLKKHLREPHYSPVSHHWCHWLIWPSVFKARENDHGCLLNTSRRRKSFKSDTERTIWSQTGSDSFFREFGYCALEKVIFKEQIAVRHLNPMENQRKLGFRKSPLEPYINTETHLTCIMCRDCMCPSQVWTQLHLWKYSCRILVPQQP